MYDDTYHLHVSQKDETNLFTVKYLLSCSMSVVLTVKVEGLIEPPLAQMASTKACYKLGLSFAKTLIGMRYLVGQTACNLSLLARHASCTSARQISTNAQCQSSERQIAPLHSVTEYQLREVMDSSKVRQKVE